MPRRALRDGFGLAGLLFAGYLFLIVAPKVGSLGFDAFAYWAVDPRAPYGRLPGDLGAFTYSPAIAQLFAPFSLLPWWQFLWLWDAVLVATLIWLGGRRTLLLLAFPPVALELYHGNIHLLMAAAIVLGFRYPMTWAFILLTKVTPGIGLLWFAARREWRSLALALGVTLAIAVISAIASPVLWGEWLDYLKRSGGEQVPQFQLPVPLVIRLIAAAAVVTWGARTDRPWTVAAAAAISTPILWLTALAVLAAVPRLLPAQRLRGAASPEPPDRTITSRA